MRAWWRRFWRDVVEGYRYSRDPHGCELAIRQSRQTKYRPRPGMFLMNGSVVVHPALVEKVRRDLGGMAAKPEDRGALLADAPGRIAGMDVYVSVNAVEQAPEGGWPDVEVPERPRLAP